jgi:hypothetical protein
VEAILDWFFSEGGHYKGWKWGHVFLLVRSLGGEKLSKVSFKGSFKCQPRLLVRWGRWVAGLKINEFGILGGEEIFCLGA